MRYWITFQWPPYHDLSRRYPPRLWLPEPMNALRLSLAVHDIVYTYQLQSGPPIEAENGRKLPRIIKCESGRQGITSICRLKEPIAQHPEFPRRRYTDGREMWWCWYADLQVLQDKGFISRSVVATVLGYSPRYVFRGQVLKELSEGQADMIRIAFCRS